MPTAVAVRTDTVVTVSSSLFVVVTGLVVVRLDL